MSNYNLAMEQYYRSVISGERSGALPALLRALFEPMSWAYGFVVSIRNGMYDRNALKQTKLPVPVISVGNITTGGTGKTPTVIMIVKELVRQGRKPAVLTRGYGAKKGERPDEVMVIEHECPGVPVIINPDRVAGGQTAIRDHGADVLVMDDGFQHRRLARDLNIVLVDATQPMGSPGLTPRGSWREPPQNLKRADLIMLTRCEQVSPDLADLAAGLLTQWVSPRWIMQQHTHVLGLFDSNGDAAPRIPLNAEKERVIAFAGIGNPNAFLHTLRTLGVYVSAASWFNDHHRYKPTDLNALLPVSQKRSIDAFVTTLKDWVKLRLLPLPPELPPIWHVRIESRLRVHEEELLRARLSLLFGKAAP